jgi:hypothetical protein
LVVEVGVMEAVAEVLVVCIEFSFDEHQQVLREPGKKDVWELNVLANGQNHDTFDVVLQVPVDFVLAFQYFVDEPGTARIKNLLTYQIYVKIFKTYFTVVT